MDRNMPHGAGHVVLLDHHALAAVRSSSGSISSIASGGCTPSYSAPSSQDGASADDSDAVAAYFVAPASHIGRVVTGVVFCDEPLRASSISISSRASAAAVDQGFSLASVAFADKLAEQGYKVVVLGDGLSLETADAERRVAQAAAFLRRQHGVQRVALMGFGAAADAVLRLAVQPSTPTAPVVDCVVALSPDGRALWADGEAPASPVEHALPPTLVLVPGKSAYAASEEFRRLQRVFRAAPTFSTDPPSFRARVFPDRSKGFAFSGITDEDAATQAIAEVLDWLVVHLHRFRIAACTSDADPWWPQGRNGPFLNVGLQAWQASRCAWITPTHEHPGRPPRVPSHLVFDGLSSVRRTFELPQRMALGDVVEIFVDIWEVQQ
ncbi:hypothetical protein P43SY_003091 [Pythium insidiosum]|uniref:Uncharacterized protein n=1 Tax=Pythium insidiosum TaxID=114742 RepID=A0AAD5M8G3_PYTIN|nr:hypothetical protein P43SY_003091 [Pythium insidiosum]